MRAIGKFMAVALVASAATLSAECRAEGSGTTSPVNPTTGPINPTGSAYCSEKCAPYAGNSVKYADCFDSCMDDSATSSPSSAPLTSSVTPAFTF